MYWFTYCKRLCQMATRIKQEINKLYWNAHGTRPDTTANK